MSNETLSFIGVMIRACHTVHTCFSCGGEFEFLLCVYTAVLLFMSMANPLIAEGDSVLISGGGVRRLAEVKANARIRLGRAGTALVHSLVGMRYGEVVELDHKSGCFVATDRYPDLDISELDAASGKDNRDLVDDNTSQQLTNVEVATLRKGMSMDSFLNQLVDNSTTFHSKTNFAQEKYLRKKQKKYGTLYKIEAITVDNLAEFYLPTINPSDTPVEQEGARCVRLRADTVALVLHHSNVHAGSRVLAYDRTNGVLEACLLTRLGDTGEVWQVMDRSAQPNTFVAQKLMRLPRVKERWRAIPCNEGLFTGVKAEPTTTTTTKSDACDGVATRHTTRVDDEASDPRRRATAGGAAAKVTSSHVSASSSRQSGKEPSDEPGMAQTTDTERGSKGAVHGRRNGPHCTVDGSREQVSQWMSSADAHAELMRRPPDCLVIVDDTDPGHKLSQLFPFVAPGGHIVVYSPFLDDLTALFPRMRNHCVNIRISETWYRHHQVLPQRTHPTVNMSTAGGYLFTALKVESNPQPRLRYTALANDGCVARVYADTVDGVHTGARKRARSMSPALDKEGVADDKAPASTPHDRTGDTAEQNTDSVA